MKHMKLSRRGVFALTLAAVFAGGTAMAITKREQLSNAPSPSVPAKAAPASITVNVVTPTATRFDRVIAATGTVAARDELIVGSDAAGVRLIEVHAEVGRMVRSGELLARGDDAQLRAQLAQFEATLKQARADHAQAEANVERTEQLKDTGVYSVETMQSRRTAAALAAAKVELAQAQVRELQVKIGQTRVIAPAGGVISKKTATVGAVVQPGTELFRVIRNNQLEWLAELPGHALAGVTQGAGARVLLEDGKVIEASVRLVAPTMDRNTRNGLVHVLLPASAPLKAGQHARGEIRVGDIQALALPESSVMLRDGYAFAYVVGADNVARASRIETGLRRGGLVEVRSGLDTEARVVSAGAGFVKDGDRVRVAQSSSVQVAQLAQQGARP